MEPGDSAPDFELRDQAEDARRPGAGGAGRDISAPPDVIVRAVDAFNRRDLDTWVLTSHVVGRGKGSAVEVEGASYAVDELRDGLVARLRLYGDRDEAFAAAGLSG